MQATVTPTISARKVAILALLGAARGPIVGVTRLQKLLFLLWKRLGRISPDRPVVLDFDFRAERYGPADFGVYADLDFLVAVGHVRREGDSGTRDDLINGGGDSPRGVEEMTEEEYAFEYLMRDEEGLADLAAAERREQEFVLTDQGRDLLKRLKVSGSAVQQELVSEIETAAAEVLRLHGSWPLQRLLRYVYTEYPDMTTASEIADRVLRKS